MHASKRRRGGKVALACLASLALAACGRVSYAPVDAHLGDAGPASSDAGAPVDAGPDFDGGSDAGFDAGPDFDGGPDAGSDAGPGLDAGTDAGPGACVPATETCNRADDDCDGFIDEGLLTIVTAPSSPEMAPAGFVDNSYYVVGWDPTAERFGIAYGWFSVGPSQHGARFLTADRTGALVGTASVTGATIASGTYLMDLAWSGSEWVVPVAPLGGEVSLKSFATTGAPTTTFPTSPTGVVDVSVAVHVERGTPFAAVIEVATPNLQVMVVNLTTGMVSGTTLLTDPICSMLMDPSVTATASGFGLAYTCQPNLLTDNPYVAYVSVDTAAHVSPPQRFATDPQQERNVHACYDTVTDRVAVAFDVQLMRGGGGPVSSWFVAATPDASAVSAAFPLVGQAWLFGEGCAGDGALGVLGNATGGGPRLFRRWRITDGTQVPGELSTLDFQHVESASTGSRYFTLGGTLTGTDLHLGGIDCL